MPSLFAFLIRSLSLGLGLAMDAFSVSVADGLKEPDMSAPRSLLVAGVYGGFQFLMPVIGWGCVKLLARAFSSFQAWIPWIALGLLLFLGIRMIRESLGRVQETMERGDRIPMGSLLLQGLATSIDALSVGFTVANYSLPMVLGAALMIGGVTVGLCLLGLKLGRYFGNHLLKKAGILGGVILIAVGLEIFLSHIL